MVGGGEDRTDTKSFSNAKKKAIANFLNYLKQGNNAILSMS
jgi:hypothetical protein